MLPTKKSAIKRNIWEYSWLLYGAAKIGKSTFASQFNDPLFIATEDRLKSLNVYKVPETGAISSWEEFLDICNEILDSINAGEFKWKTIIIDTVDILINQCTDYVGKKNDFVHPTDLGWGKAYFLINNEFFRVINKLMSLGLGVVFISHDKQKNVKSRTLEITKTTPKAPGQTGELLMNAVDIIAYIGFDKESPEKRCVYFRGSEVLDAGDSTERLLPMMAFDYRSIEAQFNNSREDKEACKEETEEKKEEKKEETAKGLEIVDVPDRQKKTEIKDGSFDFGENRHKLFQEIDKCEVIDDLNIVFLKIKSKKEELIKSKVYFELLESKKEKRKEIEKKLQTKG